MKNKTKHYIPGWAKPGMTKFELKLCRLSWLLALAPSWFHSKHPINSPFSIFLWSLNRHPYIFGFIHHWLYRGNRSSNVSSTAGFDRVQWVVLMQRVWWRIYKLPAGTCVMFGDHSFQLSKNVLGWSSSKKRREGAGEGGLCIASVTIHLSWVGCVVAL